MVTQDWKREVTPLQETINNSSNENEKWFHVAEAFSSLQPLYLKCLFSYALFFIALEGAYERFYEELNALNKEPFFRVEHNKKPKPTAYVNKVKMIRNISIAHIGSKNVRAVTSAAAMMWQPLTLCNEPNASWNIDSMTFGAFKLVLRDATGIVIHQSDDLEIKGIPVLDKQCKQYLDEFDRICSDYLKAIHARLPITVGDENYLEFKLSAPNP